MKRWLPSPLLSLALAAMWLLLNRSMGVSDVVLAVVVGLVIPWLTAPLRPPGNPMRRPDVLVKLILHVGMDVVVSALDVARGVLRGTHRPGGSAFIEVPLDLRDAHALAALAVITSVVPGTIWTELAPDRSRLLLHVFDLDGSDTGRAEFIRHFKHRYERPLKEIFE